MTGLSAAKSKPGFGKNDEAAMVQHMETGLSAAKSKPGFGKGGFGSVFHDAKDAFEISLNQIYFPDHLETLQASPVKSTAQPVLSLPDFMEVF